MTIRSAATTSGPLVGDRSIPTAKEYLEFVLAVAAIGGILTLGPLIMLLAFSFAVRAFGLIVSTL